MTDKKDKSEAVTDKKETQESDKNPEPDTLILQVEKVVEIPDGKHYGLITDVNHRTEPYGYIDIIINEKDSGSDLKLGFPDKITEGTGLGKFLAKFDIPIEVGMKIDLRRELLSRAVVFITVNEETDKGVFARIIRESVKPTD